MAYHFGLAEPQKARMETAGRVELTADDAPTDEPPEAGRSDVVVAAA